MVRQIKTVVCLLVIMLLCCGFATTAHATSYDVYDGNPSNTYIQYYRDILSGIPITKNYVVFRSGQNQYVMVVGDLVHNNGLFTSDAECSVYTMETSGNYNSYYSYNIDTIDSFYLDAGDKIIYSDLGTYPQLEERGAKYEILTAILIVAVCVGYVCKSVFRYRPR